VNVTSAAGLRGGLSPADYSTSKAGVLALTQQAACEAAPHGIRVNSVAPAYVPTVRYIDEPMCDRLMKAWRQRRMHVPLSNMSTAGASQFCD
jgi:NAD(P)-dependent dehydrogenase (short-subunit alcohol dehydrogenase family)